MTFLLSSHYVLLSKVGCNHPFQDGIGSTKKLISLLQKEKSIANSKISVIESNDTTYIESGKFSFNSDVFLNVSAKFYKEKVVEVSYNYEVPTIKERDSLSAKWLDLFRSQKNNFTEVTHDKPIHANVISCWNFLSYCKDDKGLLAVVVETLRIENFTVSVTYLY